MIATGFGIRGFRFIRNVTPASSEGNLYLKFIHVHSIFNWKRSQSFDGQFKSNLKNEKLKERNQNLRPPLGIGRLSS